MTRTTTTNSAMTTSQIQKAVQLLREAQRPLLIAHPRPDGDTIGCTLALRLALQHLEKEPTIACVHPIPPNYAYLPGVEEFVQEVPEDADIDLVVAIDMSDLSRTGGLYKDGWRDKYPLLVIDHHETNASFGDVNIVEPEAAATALPLIKVIEALGVPVVDDVATCLLAAILTDTRGLRTTATTPRLLHLVADLVERGGDYQAVMQRSMDAVPYQQMKAWGAVLSRLQLEGRMAWATFPLETKEAMGIEDHDDLNLGNFLSQIAEADIIASFLEMRNGTVKVSFRSRPGHNVAWIANSLGGGGHRQAAGCSVPGPLDEAVERVLPLVRKELSGSA
jgi:phosphoesterase RecJ-like protein